MDNLNIIQLVLSISILPMIYVCWKSDKIKNNGAAYRVMNKKIK